jgi:hypothetical protein
MAAITGALIIGAAAAGTGILSGIGGASSAKANAMAQEMQQRQQNFNNQWQLQAQNRNNLRAWQQQLMMNMQIEKEGRRQKALGEFYAKENYRNTTGAASRQTKAATDAFLSSVSARGLSLDSASAKAMVRMTSEQAQGQSLGDRVGYQNQLRDMATQYQNILGQRKTGGPALDVYLPTTGGIADNSSAILATGIASGVLSGIGAGVGAYGSFK